MNTYPKKNQNSSAEPIRGVGKRNADSRRWEDGVSIFDDGGGDCRGHGGGGGRGRGEGGNGTGGRSGGKPRMGGGGGGGGHAGALAGRRGHRATTRIAVLRAAAASSADERRQALAGVGCSSRGATVGTRSLRGGSSRPMQERDAHNRKTGSALKKEKPRYPSAVEARG